METNVLKLETEERVGEEEDESLPEGLEYQGGRRKTEEGLREEWRIQL